MATGGFDNTYRAGPRRHNLRVYENERESMRPQKRKREEEQMLSGPYRYEGEKMGFPQKKRREEDMFSNKYADIPSKRIHSPIYSPISSKMCGNPSTLGMGADDVPGNEYHLRDRRHRDGLYSSTGTPQQKLGGVCEMHATNEYFKPHMSFPMLYYARDQGQKRPQPYSNHKEDSDNGSLKRKCHGNGEDWKLHHKRDDGDSNGRSKPNIFGSDLKRVHTERDSKRFKSRLPCRDRFTERKRRPYYYAEKSYIKGNQSFHHRELHEKDRNDSSMTSYAQQNQEVNFEARQDLRGQGTQRREKAVQEIRKQGNGGFNATNHDKAPYRRNKKNIFDKDKSGFINTQSLSFQDIKSLSSLPTEKLISVIFDKIKAFQSTLQSADTFNDRKFGRQSMMDAILLILSKISEILTSGDGDHSKANQILGEVLSTRCSTFHFQLKMYVKNVSEEEKICRVCKLFENLLQTLPGSSWSCLPLEELNDTVNSDLFCSSKKGFILEVIQKLLLLREAAQNEQCFRQDRKTREEEWDDIEYRYAQIIPTSEEICLPETPSHLQKNIISGRYSNWLHYYGIHFRLLREDFVAPLRKGVCGYRKGLRGRKLQSVRVYENVLLKEPIFQPAGVCYRIQIDISHFKRYNWEHSKRLIYGSFLCLSPDSFQNEVHFATVINRDSIASGDLVIMFQDNEKMLAYSCKEIWFSMVESEAYFEAYNHILHSLQAAEVDTMPFKKYLIDGECSSVQKPQYLEDNHNGSYKLSFLQTKYEDDDNDNTSRKKGELLPSVQCDSITDFSKWPSLENIELDNSQLKALQMALTQEIAVIQGPPGTGKTYIGLKIVEHLLENNSIWNSNEAATSPILIMCLTNHALDQFLEGILKYSKPFKLVRVGGRSQSNQLTELNLNQWRKNVYLPPEIYSARSMAERIVSSFDRSIVDPYFESLYDFIPLEKLKDLVNPNHSYMLVQYASTQYEYEYALEIWLNLAVVYDPQNHRNHTNEYKNIRDSSVYKQESPIYQAGYMNESDVTDTMKSASSSIQSGSEFPSNIKGRWTDPASKDESDSESLIDIQGDATIEQSVRHFDDDDYDFKSIEFIRQVKKFSRVPSFDFEEPQEMGYQPSNPKENFYDFPKRRIIWDQNKRQLIQQGFSLEPMSEEEASSVNDIHNLSLDDRWRLYRYWHSLYLNHLCLKCEENFKEYNKLCAEKDRLKKEADRYALETADIIGMTTTGAAKYRHILDLVKPRIVIVEEAAEVLESHIVSALNAGTQHLILIGDHKQLRPKLNEYELAKKYRLDVSLFERLLKNSFPHVTLEVQHRMRPEISQLVKPHIYDTLHNHSSVEKYPDVRGVSTNLFFIQHQFKEKEDENLRSHSNSHEAEYLVQFCKYLLQQNYEAKQITILVTYLGQLLVMQRLMPKKEFNGVRICTVDNFQGEENDIILLSLVRSNDNKKVGFLSEENRICVALSRAREGFYCIGNFKMLREEVLLWETIMCDMESKGKVGDGLLLHCSNHHEVNFVAKTAKDFIENSPKGGCLKDCTFRLSCGHVCTQKCHYIDPEHEDFICRKSCARKCPEGHSCHKKCYEQCTQCRVRVTRKMPGCEHQQKMYCYEDPSKVDCNNPCKKKCPEGHSCPRKCYEQCTQCKVRVTRTVPGCEHQQKMCCYEDPSMVNCNNPCKKKCPEGHSCPKKCHEKCECKVRVTRKMPGCEHQQKMYCYENPSKVDCNNPCKKKCPKGHNCPLKCSKMCQSCIVSITVQMPSCNHEQKIECHQDPHMINCHAPCSRKCENGHLCRKQCYESCGNCEVKVTKIIPECGHKMQVPCHVKPQHTECKKPCEKILPCKHKCALTCGEVCSSKECRRIVFINLPDCKHEIIVRCYESQSPTCKERCSQSLPCGHPCTLKCGEPCETKCDVKVNKKWPCGHELKRACYQTITPEEHPCRKKCERLLKCGHACPNKCGEPCIEKCMVTITRVYPCGHSMEVPCNSDPSEFPCKSNCKHLLACGHKCSGTCSKCSSLHIHKPCPHGIQVDRFCGHQIPIPCVGLTDTHVRSKTKLIIRCSHAAIQQECPMKEYHTCDKPCDWNCPHFACSKSCSEICDRPQCNSRCDQKLKCGHRCYGVCGEPCLSSCPDCRLKHFNKRLKFAEAFKKDSEVLYYQLPCEHIFTVEYLDRYTYQESKSDILIRPLQCPVKRCSCLFSCSYRYGNHMKTLLLNMQDINAILKDLPGNFKLPGIRDIESLCTNWEEFIKSKNYEDIIDFLKNCNECYYDDSDFGYIIMPISQFSSCLRKLPSLNIRNVSKEDMFLIFLFTEAFHFIETIESSQSCNFGGENTSAKVKVMKYLGFISSLIQMQELTYQVVNDLTSKYLKLYLTVQCLFIRCTADPSTEEYPALSKTELFLKDASNDVIITGSEFQLHMKAMAENKLYTAGHLKCYTKILANIELFTPIITKGQWWKCVNGHYFCSPPSILEKIHVECPECKGEEVWL